MLQDYSKQLIETDLLQSFGVLNLGLFIDAININAKTAVILPFFAATVLTILNLLRDLSLHIPELIFEVYIIIYSLVIVSYMD